MGQPESDRLPPSAKKTVDELKDRVAELERVVTALVKAVDTYEQAEDEIIMPIGVYYGTSFEE